MVSTVDRGVEQDLLLEKKFSGLGLNDIRESTFITVVVSRLSLEKPP